jgi:hypothetical protein
LEDSTGLAFGAFGGFAAGAAGVFSRGDFDFDFAFMGGFGQRDNFSDRLPSASLPECWSDGPDWN